MPAKRGGSSGYTRERGSGGGQAGGGASGSGTGGSSGARQGQGATSRSMTPAKAYSEYDHMERVADRVLSMDERDITRNGRSLTVDFGGSKGKVTITKEGSDRYTVREHNTGQTSTASYPRAAFQRAARLPKPKTQPLKSANDIKRGEGVWYKGRAYKFYGMTQNAYSGERTFRIERDALRGGRSETEWIPLSRISSMQKIVGV